jgi:hypothetical protein
LEWILLNQRKSVGNKNNKFIYLSIEMIEDNLKGEDFFKSNYTETDMIEDNLKGEDFFMSNYTETDGNC